MNLLLHDSDCLDEQRKKRNLIFFFNLSVIMVWIQIIIVIVIIFGIHDAGLLGAMVIYMFSIPVLSIVVGSWIIWFLFLKINKIPSYFNIIINIKSCRIFVVLSFFSSVFCLIALKNKWINIQDKTVLSLMFFTIIVFFALLINVFIVIIKKVKRYKISRIS